VLRVATEQGNLVEADALTAAEKRVLALISQSMTNREIASSLGISSATVKRHLENILRKLRVRNRVGAAIYGLSMTGYKEYCHTDCPARRLVQIAQKQQK
jgi:DNA-binding CsgD family transcriptional regulator